MARVQSAALPSVSARQATTDLPTRYGRFQCSVYRTPHSGSEHLVLVCGEVALQHDVLTRIHSECLTGDAFGSLRCDCGDQLDAALERIAARGKGVLIYLRDHEGRGIGLANKIRAYALQDSGIDTVDANLMLGFSVDARDYLPAGMILRHLEVASVDLLTNNPGKVAALSDQGIPVTRQPLHPGLRSENAHYLRTKMEKMGHLAPGESPSNVSSVYFEQPGSIPTPTSAVGAKSRALHSSETPDPST